jgi:hypothetical protein
MLATCDPGQLPTGPIGPEIIFGGFMRIGVLTAVFLGFRVFGNMTLRRNGGKQ